MLHTYRGMSLPKKEEVSPGPVSRFYGETSTASILVSYRKADTASVMVRSRTASAAVRIPGEGDHKRGKDRPRHTGSGLTTNSV